MPVTFDNKASGSTNGTSLAINLTAGNQATLVVFSANDSVRSMSSMAYAGAALTLLGTCAQGEVQIWGLENPPNGINVLSAHLVGAALSFCIFALTYTNAKSTSPFVGFTSATANTAVANFSISSTSTSLVVAGFKLSGANIDLHNGTLRGSETASVTTRLVVADITGAATISLSASTSGFASWEMAAISLQFSAAVAGSTFTHMLTGIGR